MNSSTQSFQTLYNDITLLNSLSHTQLLSLLHEHTLLSTLTDSSDLMKFSTQHKINFKVIKKVSKSLLSILFYFVSNSFSEDMVYKHLTNPTFFIKNNLDSVINSEVANTIKNSYKLLLYPALSNYLSSSSLSTLSLIDLNWRFGVSTSCEELSLMGTCFLQLKLTVVNKNLTQEVIIIELSLQSFYKFMQEINKALQALQ